MDWYLRNGRKGYRWQTEAKKPEWDTDNAVLRWEMTFDPNVCVFCTIFTETQWIMPVFSHLQVPVRRRSFLSTQTVPLTCWGCTRTVLSILSLNYDVVPLLSLSLSSDVSWINHVQAKPFFLSVSLDRQDRRDHPVFTCFWSSWKYVETTRRLRV